jgi:hypothetical protein
MRERMRESVLRVRDGRERATENGDGEMNGFYNDSRYTHA